MSENKLATTQSTMPSEMILAALQNNSDLDKLKGLLELQKEWERNEAYKAFNKAMAEFKSEAITITKDREVKFSTQKGETNYYHATLANVIATTTPSLGKVSMAATWKTKQEADKICVTCRITHSMGHFEDTTLCAKADNTGSKNEIQAMGSTISYLERYTYLAALGLATAEQDDDGQATSAVVTAWQVEEIQEALKKKGRTEAPLLKYMGVSKLEEIRSAEFNKAMKAISDAPIKEAVK